MKAANHACSVFLRAILLRMKELGLNHTSLAARMKVSRPYVAKVLAGDVNISFGTALKFAKALQMDFLPVLTPKTAQVSANVASSGGSCLPSRVFAGAKANRTDRNSAYAEGVCASTQPTTNNHQPTTSSTSSTIHYLLPSNLSNLSNPSPRARHSTYIPRKSNNRGICSVNYGIISVEPFRRS